MLKKERHAFILHEINLHNRVLCSDIIQKLRVSDDTIRRDLTELDKNGKLVKVHGGALSLSFHLFNSNTQNIYAPKEKKIVAKKAASLIKDGMFVLSGGGSTIIEMIRSLPPSLDATFMTASIPAVVEYLNHPRSEVVIIGDRVVKNAKLAAGAEAINQIRNIKADICFLGINAIDPVHGITDNDWDVVQVKKAMIGSATRTICLTISEKLNTFMPIQVAGIKSVDTLITELDPGSRQLDQYRNMGIEIL
jgi:DeoR/GlpR family transcriptional regulator of sugar metabolism